MIMYCHLIGFAAGFLLDLLLGDPHSMPHPVRLIGKLISAMERKLNTKDPEKALRNGRILAVTVPLVSAAVCAGILIAAYFLHPAAGIAAEAVLTYYILAARSLRDESMKVYRKLSENDVEGARQAVSMIVGRDTDVLDETGIAKAAIETVAENTSDGVIAPLLYTAALGPVLGFFYKAVNTMDSMVGYKNERYLYFGRAAALLDDAVNFLPSRISAYLMMAACFFCGKQFNAGNAYRIHKRDCRKHASPNSAQTESTCAGALGIRLAGDASYFGVIHKKPYIGDDLRPVEYEDIRRANRLMLATALLCFALCAGAMLLIGFFLAKNGVIFSLR